MVLDLMLPDLAGEEVARSLRVMSQVPIIMLTAKASEADGVAGLRLGAADYVIKPFSPLELVARVDGVLRRARPGGAEGALSFGGGALVIDQAGREVRLDGRSIALTRRTRSPSAARSSPWCWPRARPGAPGPSAPEGCITAARPA